MILMARVIGYVWYSIGFIKYLIYLVQNGPMSKVGKQELFLYL